MLGTLILASVLSLGLCAGGWSNVHHNDWAEYETLLSGLTAVDGQSCTTTKIETQVVAGKNIRYTKQCGQTSCTITVWQKTWENFLQVTDNQCASNKRQLAGGYSTVTDQDDITRYEVMMNDVQSNGLLTLQHYTISKIETQVVAGINVKYTLMVHNKPCTIVIYDVPWTGVRSVSTNTCSNKRQLMGGYNPINVNDPNVQKCVDMSLDRINAQSNSMYRMVDTAVTKAEQQVVAGFNYAITFNIAPSTCMNNADSNGLTSADCPINSISNAIAADLWTAHCFSSLQGSFSVMRVEKV